VSQAGGGVARHEARIFTGLRLENVRPAKRKLIQVEADMLLKQTLLYLPAQVVGPIVQFLSIILWTYFLDPSEMGVLALVTAAQELGYVATLVWFTLYTVRYFDKNAAPAEFAQFLNTETGVLVFAAGLTALGVLAMPLFVRFEWNAAIALPSLAYCVLRTAGTHLTDRARTSADTVSYSVMQIVWPILGLLFGVLFVVTLGASAANVLWGYAAGQALALLPVARRLRFGRRPLDFSRAMLATAVRYGLPLVAGGLFVWLANNGLRFVIERSEGAAAVGLVTVGWGLGIRAAAFASMLVTAAAFPLAVARARDGGMAEGQAQLVRNGILLLGILAPASAGLWAIATPLVERIVAAPFREMTAAVLPWAILAGAARNMRIHFGEQVFLLREETRVPLATDIVDGLTVMGGAAAGLAYGGLAASVAGASAGAVLSLFVTLACGAYWHRFVFPASHLLRIGGATATMIFVLQHLSITSSTASLSFAIATGVAVYALALALVYPGGLGAVLIRVRALRGA